MYWTIRMDSISEELRFRNDLLLFFLYRVYFFIYFSGIRICLHDVCIMNNSCFFFIRNQNLDEFPVTWMLLTGWKHGWDSLGASVVVDGRCVVDETIDKLMTVTMTTRERKLHIASCLFIVMNWWLVWYVDNNLSLNLFWVWPFRKYLNISIFQYASVLPAEERYQLIWFDLILHHCNILP